MKNALRTVTPVVLAVVVATTATPKAFAQDVDVRIYSTADGGGSLVAADYSFAETTPIFRNPGLCFPNACLYSTTDPGFRTPSDDRPGEGLFALNTRTQVSLEVVAMAAGIDAVVVGGTRLDALGKSASLGTALVLHTHPIYQVIVPDGSLGDFPLQFRLKATGGTAYGPSPVYTLILSNRPSPTPSLSPTPTPTPNPTVAPSPAPSTVALLDHYLVYRAVGSKLTTRPNNHRFPAGWSILLDDTALPNEPADLHPDDPENYTVQLADGLANPARANAQELVRSDLHYLRYKLRGSKQGAGAVSAKGKFPKTSSSPRRLWQVTNALGDLVLESKSVAALLLPAGKSEAGPASDPGDATHFLCYQAKAAALSSRQAPGGKFRRDLQAFATDQFQDCALLADGATVPFAGTAVEGSCLIDLERPVALCHPAAKRPVIPPRASRADVDESVPASGSPSLVCYRASLSSRIESATAASLGGLSVGSRLRQAKHVKREQAAGTALATFPGNRFPGPVAIDTKRLEQICVPSTVQEVVNP